MMKLRNFHGFICIVSLIYRAESMTNRTFPERFKFGVATASYQIEGAWNEDGKGENIWDHICHTDPKFIDNEQNGDIACDSYHKYKEDVAIIKELGVDFYRFSISWARILPTGRSNNINQKGVEYYRNLITELLNNKIEPWVTIYHWDLPQALQETGGWINPELETIFTEYARVCFEQFGDLVKNWITFNEPKQTCQQGYGTGSMAPGIKSSGLDEYTVLAKIIATTTFTSKFWNSQKGRISITIDTQWFEPGSGKLEDIEAAERSLQFNFGWYANPIYNRNYPQVMTDRIGRRSRAEGFSASRLPSFTTDELDYVSGTSDFMALNTYTTFYAAAQEEAAIGDVNYWNDLNVKSYQDENWGDSASSWLKVVPWGMRKLLNWLKATYDNPEIVITENGVSDFGQIDDNARIAYYQEYLSNLLEAVLDDEVNVTAYTAWSLMDNFEWSRGYGEKFGFYHVNFTNPELPRKAKASALWYRKLAKNHCLSDSC